MFFCSFNSEVVINEKGFSEKYRTCEETSMMVYSVSTNSWRKIVGAIAPRVISVYYGGGPAKTVFHNGSVHWRATGEGLGHTFTILGFDLTEEVLWEAPIPCGIPEARFIEWYVGETRGLLSVAFSFTNVEGLREMEIWVMKEHRVADSWSKLFAVGPTAFIRTSRCLRNGRVLVEFWYDDIVVSYPKKQRTPDDPLYPAADGPAMRLETRALLHDDQVINYIYIESSFLSFFTLD